MSMQDMSAATPGDETVVTAVNGAEIEVSVVMPCLNEEDALGECVQRALVTLSEIGVSGEVVVVDNGSSDSSVEVARAAGARVVHEPERGYGNACRRGLAEARGSLLVLGDADGTYDFGDLAGFITPLWDGADMVMGTRLAGNIEVGAMPWLHRRLGNPLLTGMLNALYSAGVSDAHCGFRSITRHSYAELKLEASGMEFASEFVIAASQRGLEIRERPIVYQRRAGGEPKLRTFRDGWRHLRLMIAEVGNRDALRGPAPNPAPAHGADGVQGR